MNHTERADEARETDAAAGSILRALAIMGVVFVLGLTVVLYLVDRVVSGLMGM